MALCKLTPQEFIKEVFSPIVAVHCSSEAEQICAHNNLTFVELIQPFCKLNIETNIHDPSNVSYVLHNFRIFLKDMNVQPPTLPVGKKMINDAVSYNQLPENPHLIPIQNGLYNIKISPSTSWFEAYRDVFFYTTYPSEHEFTRNFIGCIFVIDANNADPLSKFNELTQQQLTHQVQGLNNMNKWLLQNIFKYFVLLHDNSKDDMNKSEMNLQKIKSRFGTNCYLLEINSLLNEPNNTNLNNIDPWAQFINKVNIPNSTSGIDVNKTLDDGISYLGSDSQSDINSEKIDQASTIDHPLSLSTESIPTPSANVTMEDSIKNNLKEPKTHGQYLSTTDIDKIKSFVSEFIIHGLIPYVEKNIKILNEQIPNKKGLHRSIFNATKKWLGAGSSRVGQVGQPNTTTVIYAQDAAELQVRKLGDLAFMFQLYDLAFQCYHSAKRDFDTEQAWLYFAGALEMAALSLFMVGGTNNQPPYRTDYMEKAITTYLNTCKSPQFATRATLLSTECLKGKGMYNEAALQFIRMTSEDSDLRSALLLEQAAHCFINAKNPLIRKYAFHIVLAGHRYSKAGQKKHSLRAYKSAFQIYNETYWSLAEDHINFTIGRQSMNLKLMEDACEAFKNLLMRKSVQTPSQQSTFLREYLLVLKVLCANNSTFPLFPIPIVKAQSTRVLFGNEIQANDIPKNKILVTGRNFNANHSKQALWLKLEELAATASQGALHLFNQPQCHLLSEHTTNSHRPHAIISERLSVELHLHNPLQIPLVLSNMFLLWEFKEDASETVYSNEAVFASKNNLSNTEVHTEVVQEVTIEPNQVTRVVFSLRPLKIGSLHITGVSYNIRISSTQGVMNGGVEERLKQVPVVSVMGKSTFEVKGKRLNTSIAEKSSKSYGPDNRLKPIVIDSMPKLEITIADFTETLLCGEVIKTEVEFKNVGNSELHKILVVSPTPQFFFFGYNQEYDDFWLSYKETACDPANKTAPLMAEPLNLDFLHEVLYPDGNSIHLVPGASFTIPMWFRGPDIPGQHMLDLLFYYETTKSHSKLPYRLLQHSLVMNTLPSLDLKTELTRSTAYKTTDITSTHVLKAEISNISDVRSTEISVLQISAMSQEWCIHPLNTLTRQGAITVQPQESLHLAFKVVPFDHRAPVSRESAVVFSQVPFGRSEIDSSAPPCSDFSWRAHCKLPDINNLPLPKKYQDQCEPPPPPKDVLSEFYRALKASQHVSVTFTLLWKCKVERLGRNQIVMGQHHVTFDTLDTVASTLPNFKPTEGPATHQLMPVFPPRTDLLTPDSILDVNLLNKAVTCFIEHPPLIRHDFSKQTLCFVPVSLKLINCCSVGLWISIDINYDAQSTSKPASPLVSPISPEEINHGFSWSGPTCQQIGIKPLDLISIPLKASFCYPGTYLLGCLQVRISPSKDSSLFWNQTLPPCLIVIAPKS